MAVIEWDSEGVVGALHRPSGTAAAVVVLAHGAGSNHNAVILRALAEALTERGVAVARIDLPYRQKRPKGPPSPSGAAADRAGIVAACEAFRSESSGPLIVGGHSYGGRQASMAVAENADIADGLLLTSYPLHPPGKPDRLRTEHLPSISRPTLVVHGASDPFGSTDELTAALGLIEAPTRLIDLPKVGHDLKPDRSGAPALTADAVIEFFGVGA
ncbi:alpha/beta hydrolase family protein [Gordonia rubripertincta]|uniref:Alpha/beta fold hydrolase n=1 Tax=Gordonia rubripertincta TaxID=36822 RepID=A0ABT4MQ76_GORRU|nr:alpha/beta fold hydrolase [Gordonia rubripertincta]MCZ4548845.1 alpha/beta fold hydrolase [Gordonia rubripertincta]